MPYGQDPTTPPDTAPKPGGYGRDPTTRPSVSQPPPIGGALTSAPGGGIGAFFRGIATGLESVYKGAEGAGIKMTSALAGAGPEATQAHEAEMRQREQAIAQQPSVQAYPRTSGVGRFFGEMLGTAPFGAIPGAGALPLAGRIGAAALQGGVGAGMLSGGDPKQAAIGAGLGAVPGAAAGTIGPRIQPTFQAIRQQFPHLEDMVTGRLGRTAKAFQEATANFALHPISAALDRGTKVGKDLLDQIGDKVSAAYDAVLPRMTFRATTVNPATGTSFVSEVANLRSGLPSARERDFDRLINDRITKKLDATGNMTGPEWKRADHIIGDKAARYERSSVADEQEYGGVLRDLQEHLRDTLALHNPAEAPALENANRAWSRYVQIQRAAGRRIADDEFTPSDLLYAARQSTGVRRFAQSGSDMKAFGRAGDDLINGRPPNWRKYFPTSIGGGIGAAAGAAAGHATGLPYAGYIGMGLGGAAGTGAGALAARAAQTPAARATGRVVERVGGPGTATAAGERPDPDEPHVSTIGP